MGIGNWPFVTSSGSGICDGVQRGLEDCEGLIHVLPGHGEGWHEADGVASGGGGEKTGGGECAGEVDGGRDAFQRRGHRVP